MSLNPLKPSPTINRASSTPGAYHSSQKNILTDMKDIPIPDDVKVKANEIFTELAISTKRGTRRLQMIFYCIYIAYRKLGKPEDPNRLAAILGLEKSDVNRSFSMFSPVQTGYYPELEEVNAIDLLPQLCKDFGFEDNDIKMCIEIGTEIMSKESDLTEYYPQKVAAAILQYYLVINGHKYDKTNFAKITGLSHTTINNMYSKVAVIHNS